MSNYRCIWMIRQSLLRLKMRWGLIMGYDTGKDSRQMTVCTWNFEDLVAKDSPARFIEVFVDSLDPDKDHLPSVEKLKERIAFHERCLKEMEEKGKNSLTFTDPECAMMPAKEGGIRVCYNVQTAVDAKRHRIAGFKVTDSASNRGQLCDRVQMCMKDLEIDTVKVIADKGYESEKDISDCLMNDIVPGVGFIQDREERVFCRTIRKRRLLPG